MTLREATVAIAAEDAILAWQALAEEIAAAVDPVVCSAWHRGAGARVARRFPLAATSRLDAFETSVNEILVTLGLGRAHYEFDQRSKVLRIVHEGTPFVETSSVAGWLPHFLEGAHSAWLGQQRTQGSTYLSIREARGPGAGALAFVYGRVERLNAFTRDQGKLGDRTRIDPE